MANPFLAKQAAQIAPDQTQMTALQQYLPPQAAPDELTRAYDQQSKQAMNDQAANLDSLNNYINQMAAKPQGINWTPLAAYIDSQIPGSKLTAAAQAVAPESPDERANKLFSLRNQLGQGQAKLSDDRLQALGQQITLRRQLAHEAELARHYKAMELKGSGQGDAQLIRAQTMQGNQALQQVKNIHDDSAIKQMRQQATNIDKGLDLMNVPNVSNKALSEVAQDISAALAGKAAASDFKLRELMTPTMSQTISEKLAYLTNNPDQPAPPDVVKFWRHMGERLQTSYDEQLSARAQGKLAGMQTASKFNPMTYQAAKEAADLYKGGNWRVLEGREKPGSPEARIQEHDSAAVTWAKANPKDPRAAKILELNGAK